MRKKLAKESYEEKIRKVGLLIGLVKAAPKLGARKTAVRETTRTAE
jgi:hypothetical protein